MFKYKTEAELAAMTPEQRDIYGEQKRDFEAKATQKMIADAIKAQFPDRMTAAKEKNQGKTDAEIKAIVDAEIKAEADAVKAKEDADKLQASEIKEIKETVAQLKEIGMGGSGKPETLKAIVEKNFAAIKVTKGKKGTEVDFTIKADTLRASVANNAHGQFDPTIGSLAHRKLTLYDIFRKIPIGKDENGTYRYADWDQATSVRAAAAVAEGGTFASSTAKWTMTSISLEKIGDSIPVSEEMLYDSARFAAELDPFLRVNLAIKRDDDLTTGDGVSPNVKGILTYLTAYAPAAAGIVDPSIYDLIVKVRESISKPFGSKFMPDVALMNITDINRMKLKKDANNNYILPPFFNAAGLAVDTVSVIECNSLTANTMVVGDSRYGAIIEEGDITVTTGYATGDYESDMQTLKGRQRMNLLIKNSEKLGWTKVTDIDGALTTIGS